MSGGALRLGLLLAAAAFPASASEWEPGETEVRLELAASRFDRYYDEEGRARRLAGAFGPDARGVALDALLFQFGGRIVLAPGLDAFVDVPLVRLSRNGRLDGSPGGESLYAEALAIGDVGGGARLEVPLELGAVETAFGAAGRVRAPTGLHEGVDPGAFPTGGGDVGLGGELYAVIRRRHGEAGAAAEMTILLPQRRDGADVDRGDLRGLRAWLVWPLGPRLRVGLRFHARMREADRVDGDAVGSLSSGAQPGVLVPASRLLSVAPHAELRAGRRARLAVAAGAPATSWLFTAEEAGIALSGKNILAPAAQASVTFRTEL